MKESRHVCDENVSHSVVLLKDSVCLCVLFSSVCASYTKHCHVYIFSFKPVNFPLYSTCFLLGLWAEGLWMQEREEPVCICALMRAFICDTHSVSVCVSLGELWALTHTHIHYNDRVFDAGCIRSCKSVSCLFPVSVNQRSMMDDDGQKTLQTGAELPVTELNLLSFKMQYPCETSLLEASGSVLLIN